MMVSPKLMIGGIVFISVLIMAMLVGVLGLDFFAVGFIFALLFLIFTWVFNWSILGMYSDIWNLFWRKTEGYGWIIRKWKDGYLSLRVLPLPKDNKLWFEYKERDADGNIVKRKEVCFIPFIEHDANSKAGVIIAKQGVTEAINLSATTFCKNCGYVPFDSDHSTQLVTDELHERETIGKLSMLGKIFGEQRKEGFQWMWIIAIVLLIVVIFLVFQNQQSLQALTSAINGLAGSIPGIGSGTIVTAG